MLGWQDIKPDVDSSLQKDEPDAFKELGTGNRIATWLFYVSLLLLESSCVTLL